MNLPRIRTSSAGWLHQARVRVITWWPVKMIGTALIMTAFFVAYFWVLNHPFFPVTTMPVTAIDRLIGFRPEALPLYLSLWFYLSLAPALLMDRREIMSYGVVTVGMSVIGLGIFLLWPTTVARTDMVLSQHSTFAFIMAADAAGNACPSLHVAFAVFTAIWLARILRQMDTGRFLRALNWLWCLGILYSTVAIRQHVVLDVLAGAGLGAIVAMLHLRCLRASN
ncbi:MAG TPA: phosphatase PAP2 family protein [Verrucomicrobiae bacterium]|jgi:membrane-associated phospholipid phosphatase|nr:phosphatase PAP2 family protein [Verrucomicrobiae bacterium]